MENGGLVFQPAGPKDVWTSLPQGTDTEKARVVSLILAGDSETVRSQVNTELVVEHVLLHRVTVENVNKETGEVSSQPAVRVVLVTPTGESYSASGEGIANALKVLAGFFGKPPWTGGLRVKVLPIETRKGFTTYTLAPVVK